MMAMHGEKRRRRQSCRREIGGAFASASSVSTRTYRFQKMVWKPEYLDLILSPIAFGLMLVYNLHLYIRFNRCPESTIMGVNNRAKRAWVREIMKDNDKKNILAVQTLRNSIMGSTLLATTAILLSSAIAAFMASSYDIKRPIHSSIFGAQTSISVAVKYMCLLVGFLVAFLCYVQAVRYTNHVNFIINVPTHGDITPDYVADVLERGSNFHTIGTRAFYVTIPVLLWLFGPIPFLASSIILVPAWYVLDSALVPDSKNRKKNSKKGELNFPRSGVSEIGSGRAVVSRSESQTEEGDTPSLRCMC